MSAKDLMRDHPYATTVAIVASIPLATIWWAYAVTIMWGWFIVPFGIEQIGKAHAWGLSIFISMFLYSIKAQSTKDLETILANAFLTPLVSLGLGWIAQELMG